MIKVVTDVQCKNKRVLVRVDYNVPMQDGKIIEDNRIVESLPTIKYLIGCGAKIILCSHLGRPDGKRNDKYSLKPVFSHLQELLPTTKMYFCEDILSSEAEKMSNNLLNGEIMMLENLRFYEGEEKNDSDFVDSLSKLADIFVMDAFGTAHRKHASTFGIAYKLPSVIGFLVKKELTAFERVLNNPARPVVAILGGAKIGDKIEILENLINKVDVILIGGGMCFTFIKALKGKVGKSIVDDSKIELCQNLIKKAIEKMVEIVLPRDFICSDSLDDNAETYVCYIGEIPDDMMGVDIGPKTIALFNKKIKKARTLFWNGPLGAYEYKPFSYGTRDVAVSIAKNKKCYSVVGGGDVVACLKQSHLSEFISHISTGGGAGLKCIEGKPLFALEAIEKSQA